MSVMLARREEAMVVKKRSLVMGAEVKPEVCMVGCGGVGFFGWGEWRVERVERVEEGVRRPCGGTGGLVVFSLLSKNRRVDVEIEACLSTKLLVE